MVKKSGGKVIRDHWYANDMPDKGATIVTKNATGGTPFTYTLDPTMFTGDYDSFTMTKSDGSALPTWLDWNPVTRTFAGTPADLTDVGTIHVTITKSKGEVAASQTFDIVVAHS